MPPHPPPAPRPLHHPPSMPVSHAMSSPARGDCAVRGAARERPRTNELSVLFIEAPPPQGSRACGAEAAGRPGGQVRRWLRGEPEGPGTPPAWRDDATRARWGVICSGAGPLFLLGEHELRRAPGAGLGSVASSLRKPRGGLRRGPRWTTFTSVVGCGSSLFPRLHLTSQNSFLTANTSNADLSSAARKRANL